MQQPSLLLQILAVMDNLYVVASCVLVVILIRLLWVRYQKGQQMVAVAETTHAGRIERRGKSSTAVMTPPVEPPHHKDYVLEIIDTLLIALILVFGLVRPFLLQTFFIPSSSMEPTLLGPYDPAQPDKYPGALEKGDKRNGDKLLANKFIYLLRSPERGDVVVFQPPKEAFEGNSNDLILRKWLETYPKELTPDELTQVVNALSQDTSSIFFGSSAEAFARIQPEKRLNWLLYTLPQPPDHPDDFIKRVVGQPGDHVKIQGGTIVVTHNGQQFPDPATGKISVQTTPVIFADPGPRPQSNATSMRYIDYNGRTKVENTGFGGLFVTWVRQWYFYNYLYPRISPLIPDGKGENGGEFIVPQDAVLVMGDNRNDSFDSRFWGVVPIKHVKARAVSTFWPLTRLKVL